MKPDGYLHFSGVILRTALILRWMMWREQVIMLKMQEMVGSWFTG